MIENSKFKFENPIFDVGSGANSVTRDSKNYGDYIDLAGIGDSDVIE